MVSSAREHAREYFAASAGAATINYPLWRISAMGQSGFALVSTTTTATTSTAIGASSSSSFSSSAGHSVRLLIHAFSPPYKGALATVLGMTWARAAIFWGSDVGKALLQQRGYSHTASTLLPPLVVATAVQCVNMPLVRATITIQDPASTLTTVTAALRHIYQRYGIKGLWHGTSAGILKSCPKYLTAIYVKNVMEDWLPSPLLMNDEHHEIFTNNHQLMRSAVKSTVAGIAGAALTNPVDVIRNEMFKTNQPLVRTVQRLAHELGWYQLCTRGLGKNLVAVSIPIACTIFFTDALIQLKVF